MILEIALGIVLAFVILALWREILGLGVILVVLAIVLVVGGLVIAGIYWLATEHKIPHKIYVPPRGALDAWLIQNEMTLIILALTYAALVVVYVIGQLRKDGAKVGIPTGATSQRNEQLGHSTDTDKARDSSQDVRGPRTAQTTEESVREHLRAALNEVVSDEKARIQRTLNNSAASLARSVKMMEPVMSALRALSAEVGEVEGLEFSLSPHGDNAIIRMTSFGTVTSLRISPSLDNSRFEIEDYRTSYASDIYEQTHKYTNLEDMLKFVVSAVGKHIASKQVLSERKN